MAGAIKLGHGVVPAYFSQHEAELPEHGTILDVTSQATGLPRPQAQNLLGRFLFSGWETHEKQVSVLSGGERRRLALALVVASGANLLVLDEPTNHLDLESREALEAALEAFPGTVLLVSHDRAVLDAVPDRIVSVEDLASARRTAAGPTSSGRARRRLPWSPCGSPGRRRRRRRDRRRSGRRSSTRSRSGSRSSNSASRSSRPGSRRTGRIWTSSPRTRPAARSSTALLARWEVLFAEAQAEPGEDDAVAPSPVR